MMRFVVLATPRSGSNWLCSLLDSHPDMLCHHELFNPDGIHLALSQRGRDLDFGNTVIRDRAPATLLARAWSHGLGHKAVGFKLNRGQAPTILKLVLADPDVRKVVIRRDNRIRSFVSERLAEASGEWESYAGRKLSKAQPPLLVVPSVLLHHVAENRAYYDAIEADLASSGQEAFHVTYERVGDPLTQRRLLKYLKVVPDNILKAGTRRQNPAPLRMLIANFEELAKALQGSDLEKDLFSEDGSPSAIGGAG